MLPRHDAQDFCSPLHTGIEEGHGRAGLDRQPHFDVVSGDDDVPERTPTRRVAGQVVFKRDAACDGLTLTGVKGEGGQGEKEGEGGTEGGRGDGIIVGGKISGKIG